MQSLNEIEIICINDGSTDNSLEILESNALKDSRINIVSIENHGVGYARNLGINLAKGEMVCFIDPDDFYPSKNILEIVYEKMKKIEVNICGGSAYQLRKEGLIKNIEGSKYKFNQDGLVLFREYQWSYGFWRFMFRREFLINNQIMFPLYSRWQDPPFLVKAMIVSNSFYALTLPTYVYRKDIKKVNYTYEKTRDCLFGMLDVIEMAASKGLAELQDTTINHINTWFYIPLLRQILLGHNDLINVLEKIKSCIDFSLFSSDIVDEKFMFKIEKRLISYKNIQEEKEDFINDCRRYKLLIIYGVGNVGRLIGDYLASILPEAILCYAVSDFNNDIKNYNNIAIKTIENYIEYKDMSMVIIATKEDKHEDIYDNTIKYGFPNIRKVSNQLSELIEIKCKS